MGHLTRIANHLLSGSSANSVDDIPAATNALVLGQSMARHYDVLLLLDWTR